MNLEFTEYQVDFLIKVLKKYKNLRKSHLYITEGGYKREKICDELVLIEGLISYFQVKLGE